MIRDRLTQIETRIQSACTRSGRSPSEIDVVWVTKQFDAHVIREAYDAGARQFGENRVQEFLEKKDALPQDIRWHLIGNLQTNKVKSVVGEVVLIHSCDRVALAEALEREAAKKDLVVNVLLQVNSSGESSKHGFQPDQVMEAVKQIKSFERVHVRGLMTIGPFTDNKNQIRSCFHSLKELKETIQNKFSDLDLPYISMGMSGDYEIAIEEGANILRIGSALFGERPKRAHA